MDEMWALPFMVNAFRAGTLVAVLAALLGWSLLFGSFLGITALQVEVLAVVTLVVLLALAAIGRPLLVATIDPGIAAARGVGVRGLDLAFLALTALVVAATVQITGALLVFTLLVLPAATAQRVTARPAAAIGASCASDWSPSGSR